MSEKLRSLTPLVDCDLICYRVGFAANSPDEPLENALYSVKCVVNSILDEFPLRKEEHLYLTGKDNYRDTVAVTRKYKGNREGKGKPQFYTQIRDYLVEHWNAVVIDGMEADDAQGIAQWACPDKSTCIVTTDKDLNMIPGWHYNWVKKEFNYIRLSDANRFFWWQMLVGDPTDNIEGVPKIGKKKADKIIGNSVDCRRDVERAYQEAFGDKWQERFHESAQLLWILRENGKTYSDYI